MGRPGFTMRWELRRVMKKARMMISINGITSNEILVFLSLDLSSKGLDRLFMWHLMFFYH